MKFATLTFLTAAIANLPSSSAVFAADENLRPSFGEQEASLSVGVNEEKHFSWIYSAEIKDASGDASGSECTSAFGTAFVEAWNEVHAGEDVQAEGCSVTSVTPAILENDSPYSVTTTGGGYYYGGDGDYTCKRCGPGFVASSVEEIVNALTVAVQGGDFETVLTDKCAASTSCPAFATVSKIKVKFLPSYNALQAVPKVTSDAVALGQQDKKYFRKTFKIMLKFAGGSGVPTDESCLSIFDKIFVSVYNTVNAGEDTQAETCFVASVTPAIVETKTSLIRGVSVQGGGYYYNGEGDWTCRRCSGYLASQVSDKDLEAALLDALVPASSTCFDGLSKVSL